MTDPAELATRLTAELDVRLAAADAALARGFPGERPGRQPVHTVYVPADRYDAGLVPAYGATALAALDEHAAAFAELVGRRRPRGAGAGQARPPSRSRTCGSTSRTATSARATPTRTPTWSGRPRRWPRASSAGEAAPFGGIRIKCFEAPTRARALRTLTSYVATLRRAAGGSLDGWVVTLPKVTSVDQVEAMVHVAETLDLRFEVQVETPQSILGPGRHRPGGADGARRRERG